MCQLVSQGGGLVVGTCRYVFPLVYGAHTYTIAFSLPPAPPSRLSAALRSGVWLASCAACLARGVVSARCQTAIRLIPALLLPGETRGRGGAHAVCEQSPSRTFVNPTTNTSSSSSCPSSSFSCPGSCAFGYSGVACEKSARDLSGGAYYGGILLALLAPAVALAPAMYSLYLDRYLEAAVFLAASAAALASLFAEIFGSGVGSAAAAADAALTISMTLVRW